MKANKQLHLHNHFQPIEIQLNVKNVCLFYQISKSFNIKHLRKQALTYIERWFNLVCENENFLSLDYDLVVECLKSSQLNVSSEMQVLNAAKAWINYDVTLRNKFRSKVLSKIRLHLLHLTVIDDLMNKKSPFSSCSDCLKQLKYLKENNTDGFQDVGHRYCGQNSFTVIVCGGINWGNRESSVKVKQVLPKDLSKSNDIGSLSLLRVHGRSVVVGNKIYLLGGKTEQAESYELISEIEAYSPETNDHEIVGSMPDRREYFCACSFMGMIFIFGGVNYPTSCKMFDPETKTWYKKADMINSRVDAACAVYNERIVVSGGVSHSDTVEEYNYLTNEWEIMPSMLKGRFEHDSVSCKNKLYVVGGWTKTCEVFDSLSKKFVFIKDFCTAFRFDDNVGNRVVAIGSKIILFQRNMGAIAIYDVDKEDWVERPSITGNLDFYLCCKFPKF